MGMFFLLIIIAAAIFVGVASKKFYHKPYVLNFAIAFLMLLLVIQTIVMQPITIIGYIAIAFCSAAFIIQLVLGVKNVKVQA